MSKLWYEEKKPTGIKKLFNYIFPKTDIFIWGNYIKTKRVFRPYSWWVNRK